MSDKTTLSNGVVLHRFSVEGKPWACIAYDHGPFCRRCQPVDSTNEAFIQNALDGTFELRAQPDGQFEAKLTEEGIRRAKHLPDEMPDPAAASGTQMELVA